MPLLCISLLALLLLPHSLSLSCDKRPPTEIRGDYMSVVQTELNNAKRSITSLLQNSSCAEVKRRHNHRSDKTDVVSTLYNLTCKMMHLRLSYTEQLATSVLDSIRCPCDEKPTKEPNMKSKKRTTRKRGNEQKNSRRETKKLCKANIILSTMTECYERLNTILDT